MSALRFLYEKTLRRRDLTFDDLVFPKTPKKLPVVLSPEEVAQLRYAAALSSGTFMNIVSTALMA
jgi:site-specific recombinase XerD